MVVATRTDTTLAAGWTQTTFMTALQAAFTNAGYSTPLSNYTSGTDRLLAYDFAVDNTKTFGINYLRLRFTTGFVLGQQIYSGWNAGTNTGTNGSTEATFTALSSTLAINFIALNGGSEFKLVIVNQTSSIIPLGILVPSNRRSTWDLNSWPFGFIFTTANCNVLRAPSLTPFSSTDYDTFLNNSRMASASTIDNRVDGLTGINLLTQSNTGSPARTSDDLASLAVNGVARFSLVNPFGTSQQYLVINPVAGGLGVRVQ